MTHDPDGAAVLVYDNDKRDRRDRRLPISRPPPRVRERSPTPHSQSWR